MPDSTVRRSHDFRSSAIEFTLPQRAKESHQERTLKAAMGDEL
jgi:hypothetical protein